MSTDTERKSKIPTVTVPSDDCAIYIGRVVSDDGEITEDGEPYYVHQGESVELLPVPSVAVSLAMARLAGGASQNGSREARQRGFKMLEENLTTLCDEIASRVVSWNWKGLDGKALPAPHNKPAVIKALSNDELLYLLNAVRGDTPDQRGNASTPSPDSSSTARA